MSDFMYELEDNVWDEFGASATGDHIVPRTVAEYGDQFKFQGDGRKKRRHEVNGVDSNADNTTKYGILGEKEKGFYILTKNRMLERGSWSHGPDGIFPTSGDNDSLKEVTSMCSDDPMMSNHGLKTGDIDSVGSDFCGGDPVLVDNCATEDNNIYRFPLNHISEDNNDLRIFSNNHEDKENNDLLCYGCWGDIGNFEDVDRMFRSCDSTFGLGSLSNDYEDDLCWVSSSQQATSQNVLKADAKLNCLPEHCATYRPENAGPSTIDSYNKSVISDKISSLETSNNKSGLADMSSFNASNKERESKDDLTHNEQITPQKKQLKQLSASGQRIDHHLEIGGSWHQYGNTKQFSDVKHPFTDSSCQLFSPLDLQRHKQNIGPDSVSHVQTNVPYMHLSCSSPSNQISRCSTLTSTKSENNGHPSSTNGSSCASNQAQSNESSRCRSFDVPDSITNEKRGKLYQDTQAPLDRNVDQARVESQIAFYDPVTAQKQVHQSEQDEGHSEVEGFSVGKQPGLDSSNVQESSCVSSMLHEVSLEATSFWQLQQVMEKLDIRTKLCIRDSLYRLARSAEQRHNCTDTKSGNGDDKDASGPLVAEETNKCTRFTDIETDTNPIDRSIAHLLFHRPSDPSLRPATDTASLKSHGMIHGSSTAPPVIAEKHNWHEETGAGSDKKLLS